MQVTTENIHPGELTDFHWIHLQHSYFTKIYKLRFYYNPFAIGGNFNHQHMEIRKHANPSLVNMILLSGPFPSFKKASFWKRLAALLFDEILIILIFTIIENLAHLQDIFESAFIIIFYLTYNIVSDYHFQGTLGKKIMKLRVIDLHGKKPVLINVFYRNIWKIISAVPFYDGFLRILAPHQFQTAHDSIGKCYVIEN